MSFEFLGTIRPVVVASLPGSPSKGDTCVLSSDGHLYTYNGTTWVDNGSSGAGSTLTAIQVNVSTTPVWRGSFIITDGTISPTSKITIMQAPGPYTNKGTLADEAEMDPIVATATAGTGQATVRWQTVLGVLPSLNTTTGVRRGGLVKGFIQFYYGVF